MTLKQYLAGWLDKVEAEDPMHRVYAYLLRHGKLFSLVDLDKSTRFQAKLDDVESRRFSVQSLALETPYQYFEGYALAGVPVYHAWLVRKDVVVDPFWNILRVQRPEYLGIQIPKSLIRTSWANGTGNQDLLSVLVAKSDQ